MNGNKDCGVNRTNHNHNQAEEEFGLLGQYLTNYFPPSSNNHTTTIHHSTETPTMKEEEQEEEREEDCFEEGENGEISSLSQNEQENEIFHLISLLSKFQLSPYFCEVKSENDVLSEKQKIWLFILNNLGYNGSVIKVK